MKINKREVLTLFALTLLFASLLLINLNEPTSAQLSSDSIYLHGPSLRPIHMHSNITLNPIHMHHTNGILWPGEFPITEPNCTTDWLKIAPDLDPPFEVWHLSSWEDLGDPIGELSPNDQIDMTNIDTQDVEWFHVDRMTLTLNLSGPYMMPTHEPGPTSKLLEMKQPYCNPYDPYAVYAPEGTVWHEVWPSYSNIYTITMWIDDQQNPNGMLDYTDSISFDGGTTWWHVEDVATDLILRWKMLDPIGTLWHELYPDYCELYEITSWDSYPDPWCDRISPKDTIDMFRLSSQTTHWYFVDRVTITINVTQVEPPGSWHMLELKTHYFEEMYHYIKKPLGSFWHEVYPDYCTVLNLTWWDPMDPLWDNCNGVLDPCDYIILTNQTDGLDRLYHVEDMAYDIILNEYITDPVGTYWHELHPDCTLDEYYIDDWENNTMDVWLSPCDNVTLSDPTGLPGDYHVENVTLTLNVTIEDISGTGPFMTIGERIYLEYLQGAWNYSWPRLYHPKIEPWDTNWTVVCPTQYFGENLTIWDWFDNCNGVLDYCDWLVLYYPNLTAPTQTLYVHVDEVAVDMVVQKIGEEPPPPPTWYKKPAYPDYAPSGMPDFDQKQDAWHPLGQVGHWTWCGPTAVANSKWWFDSKYDPSNIVPAFPGVPDDHDVRNVAPLVANLSWWMDTDGQRTGIVHTGTYWQDMEWGIKQYLQQQGITTLEVHNRTFPDFFWIEDEIYACQDVVLLLEFWWWTPAGGWERVIQPYDLPGGEGGHYVTCAGVNSSTFELLICDPWWDAAENGWPGNVTASHPPHADPTVHNDTQYVSHDAYNVTQWTGPPPGPYGGQPIEELVNYLQHYNPQQYGPNYHTFIKVAVVTSPLQEANDVAVTNVTVSVPKVPTLEVYQGNPAYINITVLNNGTNPQTFNVSVYADANTTVIGDEITIVNYTVTNLGSGANNVTAVTWVTTGVPTCLNYTISAYAHPVPGETDTNNNLRVDASIYVRKRGDVNGDNSVDGGDQIKVGNALWSNPGDPTYNPYADVNMDCSIDGGDQIVVGNNLWT